MDRPVSVELPAREHLAPIRAPSCPENARHCERLHLLGLSDACVRQAFASRTSATTDRASRVSRVACAVSVPSLLLIRPVPIATGVVQLEPCMASLSLACSMVTDVEQYFAVPRNTTLQGMECQHSSGAKHRSGFAPEWNEGSCAFRGDDGAATAAGRGFGATALEPQQRVPSESATSK